jgi:hypothetical protein
METNRLFSEEGNMKTMKTKQLAVVMGLVIVLGVLLGAGTAFGQLSGAIFTSDIFNNTNSNIYELKTDVYLRWIRFSWTRDWGIIRDQGEPGDGKRAG